MLFSGVWMVQTVVRRSNLVIAMVSAAAGLLAVAFALADGRPFALGMLLGVVLLANAVVRYLIAQRH